jgi:hypothetical protein
MSIRKVRTDMTIEGKTMRRRVWKIWQKWLRLSIPLNLICWIVCACCLDSKSITPAIVCLVSGLWITLLIVANSPRKERREYEDEISIEDLAS